MTIRDAHQCKAQCHHTAVVFRYWVVDGHMICEGSFHPWASHYVGVAGTAADMLVLEELSLFDCLVKVLEQVVEAVVIVARLHLQIERHEHDSAEWD